MNMKNLLKIKIGKRPLKNPMNQPITRDTVYVSKLTTLIKLLAGTKLELIKTILCRKMDQATNEKFYLLLVILCIKIHVL